METWSTIFPVVLKILVSVGLILIVLGSVVLISRMRKYIELQNLKTLKIKDRIGLKIEIIKTVASILGGAFFLFTLFFTWQNLQLTEKKNRADFEMAQERHRTDLFVKAIEQLGGKSLEVRLGGIYALRRIAWESETDYRPIMEVFTAYVRENAPYPPQEYEVAKIKRPWTNSKRAIDYKPDVKPDADIQAILTGISKRKQRKQVSEELMQKAAPDYMAEPLDLRKTDLRNADLRGDFEQVDFREAHLEGADLRGTELSGADLREAHLQRTNLYKATFLGADLNKAQLKGAKLQEADLRWVNGLVKDQVIQANCWPLAFFDEILCLELRLPPDHNERFKKKDMSGYNFEGANLQRAELYGFNLKQAKLNGANLKEARFYKSNLAGANLSRAYLEGADLSIAEGLTEEQIRQAIIDEKTKLPDYLKHLEKSESSKPKKE